MRKVVYWQHDGKILKEMGEALFHCWGTESIDGGDQLSHQSVAILELMDGNIVTAYPHRIKFLEPPK